MRSGSAWLWACVAVGVGCAEGSTSTTEGANTGGGAITGAGGSGGSDATSAASTSSGVGAMGGTGGVRSSTTTTGGMGGMGGTRNMCDFSTTQTCSTAQVLSAVSGDDGGSVGATGTTEAWFHVEIQETNGGIIAEDLQYEVALESPPGTDYDLYVYEGPQEGDVDCSVTPVQGTGSGNTETVSNKWNDDQGFGGEDDSLWLAIEVVYVSGNDCVTPWDLTVTGG